MKAMQLLLATLVIAATPYGELEAAARDRAQYPPLDQGYIYYASTFACDDDKRANLEAALKFTVAMSSSQQIAERCVPVKITETLYRLDLRELNWDWREWHHVLGSYPYHVGTTVSPVTGKLLPLVVRAGWLSVVLSDTTASDAHYRLLYGNAKLNRNDFLAFWGVNRKARSAFGIVTRSENPIGPAVTGIRQIENYPTNERGSAWGTRDSAKIDANTDPLEHLDGSFRHDAEEWLVASPKLSNATGKRGFLLAALLSDGLGRRVDVAANDVVTNHVGFRGTAQIRNWGACVTCHASGLNPPTNNRVRDILAKGVEIYAKKNVQEQIEAFHLSDSGTQLKRDNEDFAAGVAMINGLTGEQNAEAYRSAVEFYDAPVTLAQAAAELGYTPLKLKVAFGAAGRKGVNIGARLASLAHGDSFPRTSWESNFLKAYNVMENHR